MFRIFLICGLSVTVIGAPKFSNEGKEVQHWSRQFGIQINRASSESSCVRKLNENYNDKYKAKVKSIEGSKLLHEIRKDINSMFRWKRDSVIRIALEAERLASAHVYDKSLKFKFANAKRLVDSRLTSIVPANATAMELSSHSNFASIRVNTFHSVVQVPTNVFEESPSLMNSIQWSEGLSQTFRNNLLQDSKLSWQYFASSDGFTRIYPAHKWRAPHGPRGELLDFYDARSRPWYIKAAAQPKDIVVLLDISGSMTGSKRELAKNVVIQILESLTDDDFINVLKFSSEVHGISDCFGNETLVPAFKPNLREFRDRLEGMNTSEIANFTIALTHAFELLTSAHNENMGSYCNQAIMIVTDGAPENFESVFEIYNWPRLPIRVFTYLVGKGVTETHEVNWMACNNRGYYTHVANLAEVREQVQSYIPVMSRPLVLSGNSSRPVVWTSAYSEITFMPLTNWLWDERSKERIRATIKSRILGSTVPMKEPMMRTTVPLTTTIGVPVFDTKNTSKITVRVLIKNMMAEKEEEVRTANLLGVAGVDVPINEIKQRIPAYKLGVNAYSFAVTNNGMLLWHPDLRPLFQGLLKPFYNSVNLLQVELPDTISEKLNDILKEMLDRLPGRKSTKVRQHLDNMRRVITRSQDYFYGPLDLSPFSLGISLPSPYGKYQIDGQIELNDQDEDIASYFDSPEWYVHPDWIYCDAPSTAIPETPEDTIRAFIAQYKADNTIDWKSSSDEPPKTRVKLTCEKDLMQSLVFDAKATKIDPSKCGASKRTSDYERELTSKFGIALTFISTRSGLTRFQDFSNGSIFVQRWKEEHKKSIDEDFYKRAVDYHYINESSFVFSVAMDIGDQIRIVDENDQNESDMQDESPPIMGPSVSSVPGGQTPYGGFVGYSGTAGDTITSLDQLYVTASRAIFVGQGNERAPAAVAGALIKMSKFRENFFNSTLKCGSMNCSVRCEDDTIHCLVVDNNGFILISEDLQYTGKFLSEFDDILLESLINSQIFIRKRVIDYQAICVESYTVSGLGARLLAPFKYIVNTVVTLCMRVFLVIMDTLTIGSLAQETSTGEGGDPTINPTTGEATVSSFRRIIRKTRPKPCIQEMNLLEGSSKFFSNFTDTPKIVESKCNSCTQTAIVQLIPYTNLITIALVNACDCESPAASAYISRKRENSNNEAVPETDAEDDAEDTDDNENEYENFGRYKKLEPRTIAVAGECSVLPSFYRQRPKGECISSHPDEQNIKLCGLAISSLLPGTVPIVTSIITSGLTLVFLLV